MGGEVSSEDILTAQMAFKAGLKALMKWVQLYVNVVRAKLLESGKLIDQASNDSKEQFSNSPDLPKAIPDAFEVHTAMGKQALGSETVRGGLKDVFLVPGRLYETLHATGGNLG